MSNGICIFAHNNRQLDYARLSCISGNLAKKFLEVPIILITDNSTIDWMKTDKFHHYAKNIFDEIIIVDRPDTSNTRVLYDVSVHHMVPFNNANRSSIYDITPFDRTLLIDSDFLIFSDTFKNYWNVDADFLISSRVEDLYCEDRMGHNDRYLSPTGISLDWATTMMFTKNDFTKSIFDMIGHIRDNYKMYADIYRFDTRIYRNDIAFSIARHIVSGYQEIDSYVLPPIKTLLDRDQIYEVANNGVNVLFTDRPYASSVRDIDIHVMNKFNLVTHFDSFMENI